MRKAATRLKSRTASEVIIDERHEQYGLFVDTAQIAQDIKHVLTVHGLKQLPSPDMAESLEMMATKIARILNGNPENVDSWRDLEGYAKLVADCLEGTAR